MPNQAIIDIGANTTPLDNSIAASFNKADRLFANLGKSAGGINSGLGTISRNFSQFDKSLDASNARVLAFGASAGLIIGVQRAFSAVVRETINVQKAFTDINVILGLSVKNLTSFGSQLFDIAKNTGQSFKTVATAATELARQGLSASETLKRVRDASILSRQANLDVEDSLKAITAALNSFNKEALTSTQVINKLANVDAQFAVSSSDLAQAITRVGSAASDAGVDLNELIGLVTAAKQITQRDGSVIAQALNSVFARIARPEIIDQLRELGVEISNSQSGVDKLRALADALQTTSGTQSTLIREAAGGVRNLNILSAVLSDLQSKYSIVARATRESNNATDEAIQRNEELNKTYATLANRTLVNLQQVSSQFGKLTLGPALEKVLGSLNFVLEGAISKNSSNAGEILGKGILKGLGEFIGGPGLGLIIIAVSKLVGRLASESATAFKTVSGLNKVAQERAGIELAVSSILSKQPEYIALANSGLKGQLAVIQAINAELLKGTELRQATQLLTGSILKRGSGGIVPNFSPLGNAINREISSTGLPSSFIKVGADSRLIGGANPSGLGVYNLRDEPQGLNQGITRAISQGINPKTHGVPNFALDPGTLGPFRNVYPDIARGVQIGRITSQQASAQIEQLNTTLKALPETVDKMKRSFQGLEAVFKNLNQQPLLSSSQTIAKSGGLFPPSQAGLGNINKYSIGAQLSRYARQPLLLGYTPSASSSSIGGSQLEFPGYSSEGLINQQAQLNLLAANASKLQQQAQLQAQLAQSNQAFNEIQRKRALIGLVAQNNKPSLYSRFNDFTRNPANQNAFLLGSFLAPTVAGGIASSVGNQNATSRGVGASVQGLGNIIGYGALGASFGGAPGAIGGVAVGGLLEAPRILRAFTDVIPDLTQQLEKLKEQVSLVNDGFGNVIQTNEQIAAYRRGDLNLNPTQYVNLQKNRSTQISELASAFPRYSTDIRRAANSGNIEEIEKVQSIISDEVSRQKKSTQNRIAAETLYPTNPLLRTYNYLGDKLGNNYLNPNLISRLEGPSAKENEAITTLVNSSLSQTATIGKNKGKTLQDILVEDYKTRLQAGTQDKSKISILQNAFNSGDTDSISRILGSFSNQGLNYNSVNQVLGNPKFSINTIRALQNQVGGAQIVGLSSVPSQDPKKVAQDTTALIKSFFDLRSQLDLFTGKIQRLSESNLSTIQRNLDLNLATINSNAGIGILRTEKYSPFTALGIQRNADIEEINQRAGTATSTATTNFYTQQKTDVGGLFARLQDLAKKRIEATQGGYGVSFSAYNNAFGESLSNIIPNYIPELGPSKNLNSFKDNITPSTLKSFYANLEKQRDRIYRQLSSGKTEGGIKTSVLQDILETYNTLITKKTNDVEDFKKKIEEITRYSENQKKIIEENIRKQTEQIIENSISVYSSIVNNLDTLRTAARGALTSTNKNGLGPLAAGRLLNSNVSNAAFIQGQQLYSGGQLTTDQFRQNFLIPKSNADFEETGKVSGKTLGQLFGSGLQFNSRDFFQQIKQDATDAGQTMRSEFSSAFQSFVNGSKSASDAARQFGISIATNILNKVADIGFNSLIGGLFSAGQSLFSKSGTTGAARGGLIGYDSGGMVTGGSGLRDDIPRMLSKGSYVIQKSAVNKYGSNFLSSLNNGGLAGFAGGGGVNVVLRNQFDITGRKQGTKGNFNIDPALSVIGQTDENNPQNRLKFQTEQDYIGYLKTIQQYRAAVNQFNAAQNQRIYGALISAAFTVGGAGLSNYYGNKGSNTTVSPSTIQAYGGSVPSYNISQAFGGRNGGGLIGYANGGSVDNVPALLTGGEFVVRPSAVRQYGVNTLNAINSGRVPVSRFATGGLVGRDVSSINPIIQDANSEGWKQIITAINKQTKTLDDIKTSLGNKNNNQKTNNPNNASQGSSITNQVSINITLQDNGKTTGSNSQTSGNGNEKNKEDLQKFAKLIENVTLQTIITQQRDGGILASSRPR